MVPPCSDRISRVPPYSRIQQPGHIRGYHPLWPDFPDRSVYNCRTTGLFRVRSPLLAESLLMSFPPGTEMFQFPGFASPAYGFSWRYPCGWVAPFGYPRINACSRLPVAFRSVPRPSSPPGAKASTECPYRARDRTGVSTGLDPPCTGAIHTQSSGADHPATQCALNSAHIFHASERSRCCRWPLAHLAMAHVPVRLCGFEDDGCGTAFPWQRVQRRTRT